MKRFRIGEAEAGAAALLVIAGPCVIESAELCLKVATHLKSACARRGLPLGVPQTSLLGSTLVIDRVVEVFSPCLNTPYVVK